MVKIGKPVQIRFEADTLAKLAALSASSGHPVAALIRWCVDKSLPMLAENIARQVPNESTIDSKPEA